MERVELDQFCQVLLEVRSRRVVVGLLAGMVARHVVVSTDVETKK